jgi:hypothetical protein
MPRAGFEPAIPMFERPKTELALDRAAIETGGLFKLRNVNYLNVMKMVMLSFLFLAELVSQSVHFERACSIDFPVTVKFENPHALNSIVTR